MANFKYFADLASGEAVELGGVFHDGHISTKAHHFFGRDADGKKLQVTRVVEFKRNPSRHACDARCLNATGRVMRCECSCGGKNHGRGHVVCN